MMDYDKITEHVGEMGKYHMCVYVLVLLPSVFVGMNMLSNVFNSASPKHRCFITDCDNSSSSFMESWVSSCIPESNKTEFNQCQQYEIISNSSYDHCPPLSNTNHLVFCDKWKYDDSVYESTVVTTWNLVCDDSWLAPLSGSLWMVGVIIGAVVFGDLSDRFGRRKIIIFSIFLFNITGFIVPFSVNYEMFLVVRIVEAAATTGIYQTGFVVGQSKRVFCGTGINFAFAFGEALLGAMAYFIRDWRNLQFYLAVPNVMLIPESARWLIAQGRTNEARTLIKKIAVFNNTFVPMDLLDDDLGTDLDQSNVTLHLHSTSSTRSSRKVTVLHLFMNTVGYYGISMNATNLQGNVYVDFILTSLVEFPAYIFCLLVMNRLGRKKPLVGCMLIGGLSCVCTVFVPEDAKYQWISIGLSLIGKFGSAAAFAIVYVFSIELFPTVLRNNGIGLSSTFAHIGGVLAPYIASFSSYGRAVPLLIFGLSSLLAGCFAMFLPETLHQKLPETVDDAENFGRREKED
uniref:Major facilitator superfamily (MFS) profile domain-containing protein n=1 Tax=Strigamia maritima TaxID=126957 RepID=T1JLS1_STRMM